MFARLSNSPAAGVLAAIPVEAVAAPRLPLAECARIAGEAPRPGAEVPLAPGGAITKDKREPYHAARETWNAMFARPPPDTG